MISTTIGMILGRLIFSYFFVFLVVLIFSKFKFKVALQRVHSFKGMMAVSLLLVIPFLATMGLRI